MTVNFLNDAYDGTPDTDRNLYLDGVSYNGAFVPRAAQTLYSSGPVGFGVTDTTSVPGSSLVVPAGTTTTALPVSDLPSAAEDTAALDAKPHAFSGMLRAAEIDALEDANLPPAVVAVTVDSDVLKQLVLIERADGITVPEAKIAARVALSLYEAGMQAPQPSHLPAAPHEKLDLIGGLTAALEPQPAREALAPWEAETV